MIDVDVKNTIINDIYKVINKLEIVNLKVCIIYIYMN